MEARGVSVELTLKILNSYNNGEYDAQKPIRIEGLPEIDGEQIVDMREEFTWGIDADRARENLGTFQLPPGAEKIGTEKTGKLLFSKADLTELGEMLLPYVSFGILNGGSATSYGDLKKNRDYR